MYGDRGLSLTAMISENCPVDVVISKIQWCLADENSVCLRHPHGFYVALLSRNAEEEWRFHLWPKGVRQITGMPGFVHTHDRQVESRVLLGQLNNKTYDAVDTVDGEFPLYQVGYSADRYLSETKNWLERLERRVDLHARGAITVNAGSSYCVEREEFHEVVVSEAHTTATLVRMTAKRPQPVYVVGVEGFPARIDFTRSSLSSKDLLTHL